MTCVTEKVGAVGLEKVAAAAGIHRGNLPGAEAAVPGCPLLEESSGWYLDRVGAHAGESY